MDLKRVREFSSIIQAQIPASSTHVASTGAAAFQFTPDCSRLIMSTALSSYILVIDLTGDKPRVLRRFDQHRMQDSIVHDRVIKGRAQANAPKVNGHAVVNGDGDVDMADVDVPSPGKSESSEESEEASDSDDEDVSSTAAVVSVGRIAVSADGQWLATSDSKARTHVFNLDLISVRLSLDMSTLRT
jgi:U3 small nucleolar RNA-associated protein 4